MTTNGLRRLSAAELQDVLAQATPAGTLVRGAAAAKGPPAPPASACAGVHDAAAERALAGIVLRDPGAYDAVAALARAEDLYATGPRAVFAACAALVGRGEPIDMLSVAHEMEIAGTSTGDRPVAPIALAGGRDGLDALIAGVPEGADAGALAGIVARDAMARRGIAEIGRLFAGGRADPEEALRRAGEALDGVHACAHARWPAGRASSGGVTLEAALDAWWDEAGARREGRVHTGIGRLDAALGGLRPGNLVIVGGRPGVGKSSFLLNVARNAALGQGKRVALVSLEMSTGELVERLLALECGIDARRLRLGETREDEERRLMDATGRLAELPVVIDEGADVAGACRRARRRLGGLDVLVLDYVQLLGDAESEQRVAEVSAITRGLKRLARVEGIVVVAGSQLNRAPVSRKDGTPRLSDLRESGSLEQDGDVVVLLHRPDDERPGEVELRVGKNRHGPTAAFMLAFDGARSRFTDPLAPEDAPPAEHERQEAML